jgi:hypothetical protein
VIKGVQEHGHLDARPATELLALIAELRYRPTNLGIVPAPNVIVLDIDPRNGGPETLRSLEARYGALPPTLSVYTGGGGEHRWFTTDHPTGSGSSVRRVASIGAGLDIKTAGGLLVAPPSTHITGRRYAWTNRRHPPAVCPPWLDENTQTQQTDSGGAHRPLDSSSVAPGVIAREMAAASVGERAVTLFRLACWALRTDDDLDALTWAARGVGLPESKIRSQIACARQAVGR